MEPKLSALDQFIAARVAFRMLAAPQPPETRDEAAKLIGVDPYASRAEIEKAYHQEVLKSHPDRGGDPDRMVELNVARDILEGKRNEKWKSVSPSDESEPSTTYTGPKRPVERKVEVSLHTAMTNEGVPSGVQWVLASNTGYGDRDMGAYSIKGVVYYGKTDTKHIFLGVLHDGGTNPFTMVTTDIFSCYVKNYPISGSIAEIAPRAFREVFSMFSGLRKGYNAKVTILPDGFDLTERNYYNPPGKEMSFKDAIVNLGLVGDEHRWKTNQKLKVILKYENEGLSSDLSGKKIELDINGKSFDLDSNSIKLLAVSPKSGWTVLDKIFGADKGQYYYGGSKKDLTRSRNGKEILTWMAEKLTTEPQELRDLLTQAASQMK